MQATVHRYKLRNYKTPSDGERSISTIFRGLWTVYDRVFRVILVEQLIKD